LGCLLYQCLTGQPPFVADHVAAVLARILFEEPVSVEQARPGIPKALSALLEQMLQKDPAKRISSAEALTAAIPVLDPADTTSALVSTVVTHAAARPAFAE